MKQKRGLFFHHVQTSPYNWMIEHLMEAPVIENGIFEDDFYKFSMGQFIYNKEEYRNAEVTFVFQNRTKSFRPLDYMTVDDIQREYEFAQNHAALTNSQRHYLDGTYEYDNKRMFTPGYLTSLQNIKLPDLKIKPGKDGQLNMSATGKWIEASHTELPMMKIVKALYTRSVVGSMSPSERHAFIAGGVVEAEKFIKVMKENPGITMADFANRRAAFPAWLWFLNNMMVDEFGIQGQFKGTSRTDFAEKLDIMPVGTNAHELWMVIAALYFDGTRESLQEACRMIVKEWLELYGPALAILLPDTFTTEFLYETLSDELFEQIKGIRPDSGNMEDRVELYRQKVLSVGQDPRKKLVILSDGVVRETMLMLYQKLHEIVRVTFGVGTGFGSNIPGLLNPSIVAKAMFVNGKETCKLSDNLAKSMGDKDPYLRATGAHVEYDKMPTS